MGLFMDSKILAIFGITNVKMPSIRTIETAIISAG